MQIGQDSSVAPSSAFLAPVGERKPARRVRKKHIPRSYSRGFPAPVAVKDLHESEFARNAVDVTTNIHPTTEIGLSDADRQIANKSEYQIQQAVSEIHERLSPENIQFLRSRSSKTKDVSNRGVTEKHCQPLPETNVNIIPLEAADLAQHGVSVENDKLLWTKSSTSKAGTELYIDDVLDECSRSLGSLGTQRFDFEGRLLSHEEIIQIPSHLGLHHHGANPADAGYTLSELILLTRSTVRGQRIIALETLARVIRMNPQISSSLSEAGALSLLFKKLEGQQNNLDMATGTALLTVIEAILEEYEVTDVSKLTLDAYFASYFYSSFVRKRMSNTIKSLLDSDLVPTLVLFSRFCIKVGSNDKCMRALNVVRYVSVNCDLKYGSAFLPKVNISSLFEIALDRAHPVLAHLASDILSHFILFVGWSDPPSMPVQEILLSSQNLLAISSHLQLYLKPRFELEDTALLTAAASLRVLRAALVFDTGTDSFVSSLTALSVLCNPNCSLDFSESHECLITECFCAIEAYIHSLYSILVLRQETSNSIDDADLGEKGRRFLNKVEILAPFVQYANRILAQDSFHHRTQLKTAALHFVASFTSVFRNTLTTNIVDKILSDVEAAIQAILDEEGTPFRIQEFLCFTHGAGRMLSKFCLPTTEVKHICQSLMLISREKCLGNLIETRNVAAHSATDWLLKLARKVPNLETARLGVDLIPLIEEPQFFVECLFKCVIHTEFLVANSRGITSTVADRCVKKLREQTLRWFLHERKKSDSNEEPDSIGLDLVVRSWLENYDGPEIADNVVEEGSVATEALVSSDLLSASSVYRILPFVSPSNFVQASRFSKLVLLCGHLTYCQQSTAFDTDMSTKISSVSSEKPAPFTSRLIFLCDKLVERGPFVSDASGIIDDALASIVLNVMCRRDIHTSLRLSLWRSAVRDCGGGALFTHARLFSESSFFSGEDNDDDDEVIAEYCSAIANGLMNQNRCSLLLRKIIFSRVCARLHSTNDQLVLSPLFYDACSFSNTWDFLRSVQNSQIRPL